MQIDVEGGNAADQNEVEELLINFADWIYRQLESAYEWEHADEQVNENITCNEYTFTADGRRY